MPKTINKGKNKTVKKLKETHFAYFSIVYFIMENASHPHSFPKYLNRKGMLLKF